VIALGGCGESSPVTVRTSSARTLTVRLYSEVEVQFEVFRLAYAALRANPLRKRVTIDDVSSINERALHVLAVNPQQDKDLQLQWGNKNASVKVVGAAPTFVEMQPFAIDRGRVFTSSEDIGRQRVERSAFEKRSKRHARTFSFGF